MTEPFDPEAWFLANLRFIDLAVAGVARRTGIANDDAEEFASWAKERLWEHDYALLRKWRGESKLTTYATVVIMNLGREFRVQRWGRWRPSAAAQRLGRVAILLEQLVHRDGLRLEEAGETLRTRGETTQSTPQLGAILARLPRRTPPRRVADLDVALASLPDDRSTDARIVDAERDEEWAAASTALAAALATLPPLWQAVIRMHYLLGHRIADVARALHEDQKQLYRIRDRALAALAGELAAAGVTPERVRGLLGGDLPDPAGQEDGAAPHPHPVAGGRAGDGAARDSGAARPSTQSCGSNRPDEARGTRDAVRSWRSDA